ncbi:MAG: hypothetical protein JW811_07860 [Clostridiales bacterium]|nr:hypothetical protein [Clostridiales bacterium]
MSHITKLAVAYFDVLGFTDMIKTEPLANVVERYQRMIEYTNNYMVAVDEISKKIIRLPKSCDRYIFSDSILLVANKDTNESFVDLISYAWRFLQIAMVSEFPLRGAITYGDVLIDPQKGLYLGKPIVEAVELEKEQDWMGAIVADSTAQQYTMVFEDGYPNSEILQLLFPIYTVPLKNNEIRTSRVINWRENIISDKGTKAFFKNPSNNQSIQRKIDNTLEFAKAVVKIGAYFNCTAVPQRYRHLFVSKEPPERGNMPKHGDEY